MPRRSSIRTAALAALADGQRYAPPAALARQVDRIEQLAAEVDPDAAYPEDWLVYRVTGYRPSVEEPALVVGAALRADLSALAQRLSERLPIADAEGVPSAGSAPAGLLTIDEVASRWGVSRRTVERYRRHGLVARRQRLGGGRVRTVFSERAVEAFERGSGDRLRRAAAFSRLTEREVDLVRRRARRYAALGWSREQAAGRLAQRLGRSRAAVLRAIPSEGDGRAGGAGGPGGSGWSAGRGRGSLTPRQRRLVERADRWGVDPSETARRLGRSRATVHRVAAERRAEALRRSGLAAAPSAGARDEAELERVLGAPAVRDTAPPAPITTWDAFADAAGRFARTDPATELARARAMRALIARAAATAGSLRRAAPSASAIDRVETDLRWADRLRLRLVEAELAVIRRALDERLARDASAWTAPRRAAMFAAAMRAALGAAGRFDPERGGRLAAPISLAVLRLPDPGPSAPPAGGAAHQADELSDWTRRPAPWSRLVEPPALAAEVARSASDPRARELASLRWVAAETGPPRTRAASAAIAGVPVERVEPILRGALRERRRARAGIC